MVFIHIFILKTSLFQMILFFFKVTECLGYYSISREFDLRKFNFTEEKREISFMLISCKTVNYTKFSFDFRR
jgi:hypothetical protein